MNIQSISEIRFTIENDLIPKSNETFGGANLIITSNVNSPYTLSHNERYPQDIIVRSEYYLELSWLVFSLKDVFIEEINYSNKYGFYPLIGEIMIREFAKNQSISQVCLIVIDEVIEGLKKGLW